MAALSYALAFAEFPVPLSPPFARMDFSDFPALIGAYAFGPLAGVLIELVKNALQLITSETGGVGELANFLIGTSFVFTAGLIYRLHKPKKTAWLAGMVASFVMGVVAALANYYILLPLFAQFMPLEDLIASFEAYIPFIHSKRDIVLYNAFPFNLLKGIVICVVTMLVYQRLRPILKGKGDPSATPSGISSPQKDALLAEAAPEGQ